MIATPTAVASANDTAASWNGGIDGRLDVIEASEDHNRMAATPCSVAARLVSGVAGADEPIATVTRCIGRHWR